MRNVISYFPKEDLKSSTELFNVSRNVTFSGGGNASSKAMILADIFEGAQNRRGWAYFMDCIRKGDQGVVKKACEVWSDVPTFFYKNVMERS
jgi:hypothetical protein